MARVNPEIISREIEKEFYLIDARKRNLYGFNEVGNDIWRLLSKNYDEEKIVREICALYDTDFLKASEDVKEFCGELKAKGIIK